MYGMSTIGTHNLSECYGRNVLIEVTGGSQKWQRHSQQTLKVPYSSLSQTIQRITRMGGKVINITLLPLIASESEETQHVVSQLPQQVTQEPEKIESQEAESVVAEKSQGVVLPFIPKTAKKEKKAAKPRRKKG
ncbi:MAG: hypothetical protein HC908_18290 [Calothrix sp. SM1_7_51]|nr:hypothetical protein [Calothrix sp. SM1_7_51]